MKRLDIPIAVEGKYDVMRLKEEIDGTIIPLDGFRIYKDKEKLSLLRRLAKEKGLIILTDSDSAGFQLRNFLRSTLFDGALYHAYIPDVYGKEKRKRLPGKEGKIGVEGMSADILIQALEKAGIFLSQGEKKEPITSFDLFSLGFSGAPGAEKRRKNLLKRLSLPERMTTKALLPVLNLLYTKDAFFALAEKMENGEDEE